MTDHEATPETPTTLKAVIGDLRIQWDMTPPDTENWGWLSPAQVVELDAHATAWERERADCLAEHPPEPWAAQLRAENATLRARLEEVELKYRGLLFAVSNKHEGESRHETALRYILEAERSSGPFVAPDDSRARKPCACGREGSLDHEDFCSPDDSRGAKEET